jgi:hypothetical protein
LARQRAEAGRALAEELVRLDRYYGRLLEDPAVDDSLRAPAGRTIAELQRLQDSGTSLGAAEAADLGRIAEAAGLLLRFADDGAVVFGSDRAASDVPAVGNPEPRLLGRVLIVDDMTPPTASC